MKIAGPAALVSLVSLAFVSEVHGAGLPSPEWAGEKSSEPYGVTWKQTKAKTVNQSRGGLGSSVKGMFPAMSSSEMGVGCGIDWSQGQVHAGFDGGDGSNGVGGGFTWMPHGLSSIVGVHFKDTRIDLNLTITDHNQVLLSINGNDLDWHKVLKAHKSTKKSKPDFVATGKDAGPVQYKDGHPYALDKPEYRDAVGNVILP